MQISDVTLSHLHSLAGGGYGVRVIPYMDIPVVVIPYMVKKKDFLYFAILTNHNTCTLLI